MSTSTQPGGAGRAPRSPVRRAVLVGLALGVGVLATSAPVWVRAVTSSAVAASVPLEVAGAQAAPGAGAGGLVLLAAALALALAGRWGRRLAGAGIALGGLLVAASAAGVALAPDAVARSAAQDAVGVADAVDGVTVTAAPWACAVLGVLAVAHGLAVLVRSGRWPAPVRRYAAAPTAGGAPPGATAATRPVDAGDDQDAWDALTRGDDPT